MNNSEECEGGKVRMLKGNKGYSIIEVLILLVVSGILLAGILKLSSAFQSVFIKKPESGGSSVGLIL